MPGDQDVKVLLPKPQLSKILGEEADRSCHTTAVRSARQCEALEIHDWN